MILAEKIMNERKRNGWSQEELADQLSVSRQSVSKWEGGQAIPDLTKIIKMAELFGVSTDYLLKDELEPEPVKSETINMAKEAKKNVKNVSMEEAGSFLKTVKKNTGLFSAAVSMCVVCPVPLIFLAGMSESHMAGVTEALAAGVGLLLLLLMVAAAVAVFLFCGATEKQYEYLENCPIETEYGVRGMVKEKQKAYETSKLIRTIVAVVLCILCPVPLLVATLSEMSGFVVICTVCVLLIIVAIAVYLFVSTGRISGSYEKLLQENDYTIEHKRAGKVIGKIGGIYWTVVLAGYLGWSFYTNRWDFTWMVWPVAAILFGAVSIIVNMAMKVED